MGYQIPLDTFYIMVAQKVPCGTPTQARRYGEAIQEVIYEQLAQNDECYWYGFGNFMKSISSRSGQYREVQNFGTGRRENMFIEPKYILGFDPAQNVIKSLNDGEEKLPRKKHKRKYKSKNDYQAEYNKQRRKEVESTDKWVDGLLANARYGFNMEEDENGKEGLDED